MSGITKNQYDSIVSEKRFSFGKFTFVDIDDKVTTPNFKCCNGIHCLKKNSTTSYLSMPCTQLNPQPSQSFSERKNSIDNSSIFLKNNKPTNDYFEENKYCDNLCLSKSLTGSELKNSTDNSSILHWSNKSTNDNFSVNKNTSLKAYFPEVITIYDDNDENDFFDENDYVFEEEDIFKSSKQSFCSEKEHQNYNKTSLDNRNEKEMTGELFKDDHQWLQKDNFTYNTSAGMLKTNQVIALNDNNSLKQLFPNDKQLFLNEKDFQKNNKASLNNKYTFRNEKEMADELFEDDDQWFQRDDFLDNINSEEVKTNQVTLLNKNNSSEQLFQNDEQLFRNEKELQNFMTTTSNKLHLTRNDMHGKFKGFIKDNGAEFQNDYELLDVDLRLNMYRKLKNVFGFNNFRHRQKSAIVAALLNNDCFILMPTGAGKSLCYILPALLMPGITVVITPLRSLMEDQIMKLKNWKIPCAYLKAGLSTAEVDLVYTDLLASYPRAKLLYVTPEMVCSSTRLEAAFKSLYSRRLLARFVVDEAHCISQWGHDFRPDYTRLTNFFEQFSDYGHIPIAGLTATATPKIVTDARNHLGMVDSKFFISSFVRSNLIYNVMEKSIANFKKLIGQFKITYQNGSGIVYCLSRKDCETTAALIGSDALPYHSELPDNLRLDTQKRWMTDKVKIICATIAFGMGIDKPDVRFVIHHSLSQSIESYYQETGRAGRDGKPSHCVLLYNFNDHLRILRLFEHESGKEEMKAMKRQNLTDMLNYCENVSVCRRKILVEHFGEIYDAEECKMSLTPCTLCAFTKNGESPFKLYEFTDEALAVLESMKTITRVGIIYVADVYRGGSSRNKAKIQQAGHDKTPMYERGAALSESDAQRFIRKLVIEGYLRESVVETAHHSVIALLQISNKGLSFVNNSNRLKICFHITVDRKRLKRKSNGTEASVEAQEMFLLHRIALSEAEALKEKYRVKNLELFRQCQQALTKLFEEIAQENNFLNYLTVISLDGIEQLAALMPRTNSELLQVDTMTIDKVKRFGPRIMEILSKFWTIIDEKEHNDIVRQLDILKNQQINDYSMPMATTSSSYGTNSPNQQSLFNTRNNRSGSARGEVMEDGMKTSFVNKQYGAGGGGGYNKKFYKNRGKVFKTPVAVNRARPKTPARGVKRGGFAGRGSSQNQKRNFALNSALFPTI